MADGFLGTRASASLDLVVVVLGAGIPWLLCSLYLARCRGRYLWHRGMQTALAIVLFATVVLFEIDVRRYGWQERAADSPFWRAGPANDWVEYSLWLHLVFAVPTPLVWASVLGMAWRRFPSPPRPDPHSSRHRWWGYLAAFLLCMTAVTGWLFYWLAFVAD